MMINQTYPLVETDLDSSVTAGDERSIAGLHRAMSGELFTTKRFIVVFASIFLLGLTPLLLLQPGGASNAGLSLGFTVPIERLMDLFIFVAIGVYASFLRGQAMVLVPLSFLFLYVIGMATNVDSERYALMPMFMLGAVMLFAVSVAVAGKRANVIAMLVAASVGFHFGRQYLDIMPDIASPLYFMIGNILSFALIFAAAISFGLFLSSLGFLTQEERQSHYY